MNNHQYNTKYEQNVYSTSTCQFFSLFFVVLIGYRHCNQNFLSLLIQKTKYNFCNLRWVLWEPWTMMRSSLLNFLNTALEIYGDMTHILNQQLLFLRCFRSYFGTSSKVCCFLWMMVKGTVPSHSRPVHLLWGLLFLKMYLTENVDANIVSVDEKHSENGLGFSSSP